MEQQQVTIVSDEQASPENITTPPRRGKWYDIFNYIANPERFCQRNLEKYGAIFNTGVFGGTKHPSSKCIYNNALDCNHFTVKVLKPNDCDR